MTGFVTVSSRLSRSGHSWPCRWHRSLPTRRPASSPHSRRKSNMSRSTRMVTDQRGAVVRDLRKEDFQIFEDGKSQSIAGFAFVEIPIETPGPGRPRVHRARCSKQRTAHLPAEYMCWFSTICIRAPLRTQRVKRGAQQFIDRHLGANDLMAVVAHWRRLGRIPGIYEQQASAFRGSRPFHGTEGRVCDPGAQRPVFQRRICGHGRRWRIPSMPNEASTRLQRRAR